ncbi:MAG: aldo/keto reductase, partial [Clostridia bacterium]|nr:aldo/keto reductase [Clostridia bacterium]
MISKPFENLSLPLLGFGAMRLPVHGGATSKIDEDTVARMVDEAYAGGVRYFDTAYPYHDGESERVMGRLLKRYPRDSWYLADKYPGHQVLSDYVPGRIFEEQLKKCGVEYFDFYLLHNVCESSLGVYTDKALGIVDYFLEQKRLGRIKHLGFSAHGSAALMERFLDAYPGNMAFCQIQLNYLDWTFQNAKEKYELLMKRGIPVWVMEPIRGGKLAA